MVRKILWVAAGLTLLLAVAFFIFAQSNKPTYKGSLTLNGLSGEVEVYYDDCGVPHIYAGNEADAYRALGYVHA